VLRTHPGSRHPTDSGRRFHDAKDSDASSRRNLTLNRLEGCEGCDGRDGRDGCDGRGDEFYGYTRLRQPNDKSIGHVRDEYGEQFGRSLGQHHVNTLGGHCVNTLGGARINTLGGVRVNIGIIRMSSGQHRHHRNVFEAFS
jgi:hypothetical protein